MRRIALVLTGAVVMAVMLAINASTALSQTTPGYVLDDQFGDSGKVTTNFFTTQLEPNEYRGGEDDARGIAIQPDGKLVVAGSAEDVTGSNWNFDFGLARYNSDGSLDTSFGNGGKVTTVFSDQASQYSDMVYAVALQDDGKIVAAGSTWDGSNWNFALARYNSDGSLDTSFGNGGKVTTDFSSGDDEAHAVALQSDGKIVAGGVNRQVVPPGGYFSNYDFALARYNTDGSLDASFDGDGKVTTDFAGHSDEAKAVAIQKDGKIVAAGSAWDGSTFDVALARYNSDGSLDASFDGDGKVFTDFDSGWADQADDIALQPDGKIIAVGTTYSGDFALVRYNTNGSLDTSFGNGGKVTTDFFGLYDYAHAVVIQGDGKIVAAGSTTDPDTNQSTVAMARYNADGTLDANFGKGGKASKKIGLDGDEIDDLAIQPDGKIVAAGRTVSEATSYDGYYDFLLVRYSREEA